MADTIERRREFMRTCLLGAAAGFVVMVGAVVGIDQSAELPHSAPGETITAVTAK